MKKVIFVLALAFFLIGTAAPGFASPEVGHNHQTKEAALSPLDGEPVSYSPSYTIDQNLLASVQTKEAGGSAASSNESGEDLDEIVDDAIDHWEDKPLGEPWPLWIGWIVAAALIIQRAWKYFSSKKEPDGE